MKPLESKPRANGEDAAHANGETKPRTAVMYAVLERNLERFPWARISGDHGEVDQIELLLDPAGEHGRVWRVRATDARRIPGPMDADVYVAVCALYNSQVPRKRRGDERSVYTTLGELATLMGKDRGGKTYKSISDALMRLRCTEVHAVRTFREKKTAAEKRVFSVLGDVTFGRLRDGDRSPTAVTIELSRTVADSIARRHFRLVNVAEYFAIRTPAARRLYRYLDVRRWRGTQPMPMLELPLRDLAQDLPIDRDAPSHIRRTLDPAHAQLIERCFLAEVRYENRSVPGKKRPDCWVVYRYANPAGNGRRSAAGSSAAAAPATAPRDPRADPGYVQHWVGEILALLRDEHSTGFYVRCVRGFATDVLANLVGGVRQAIMEGLPVEVARKTFTAAAKRRARQTGVPL